MASCKKNTCAANRQSQDRYFVWEPRVIFHKLWEGVKMSICVCVIDLDFLSGTSGHFRDSGKVRRDNFVWSIQVTKF